MPEQSDLDRRLRAVERALTDGDHDLDALSDVATFVDRLEELEARIDTLEERTDDLDAANQAVRGYVGNVRSVNEDVEERADAALAAVDRIETRLDDLDRSPGEPGPAGVQSRGHTQAEGRDLTTGVPARDGLAEDGYDIEMPPPASNGHRSGTDDQDDDRSVIQRVREAL